MYGCLRTENIFIKLDKKQKYIEDIRFLSFGHMIDLDDAFNMIIPE